MGFQMKRVDWHSTTRTTKRDMDKHDVVVMEGKVDKAGALDKVEETLAEATDMVGEMRTDEDSQYQQYA